MAVEAVPVARIHIRVRAGKPQSRIRRSVSVHAPTVLQKSPSGHRGMGICNDRIGARALLVLSCAVMRDLESMLRAGMRKILLQQNSPESRHQRQKSGHSKLTAKCHWQTMATVLSVQCWQADRQNILGFFGHASDDFSSRSNVLNQSGILSVKKRRFVNVAGLIGSHNLRRRLGLPLP